MGASVALPSPNTGMSGSYSQPDNAQPAVADHDAQLMLLVRDGDTAAFAKILERYRNPAVSFMFRMVQDQGVAEELAQELFLRVYRARGTYEPSAKFTTWMFRIATHLALNWLRDHKNEKRRESLDEEVAEGVARQVLDHSPNAEQHMVAQARLHEVRRAVEMLPDKQRAAVLMHKYQDLEYAQIARSLECSESAVKSLLFRAYERLRSRLAHLNGNQAG
jgi:RNA polymerase sigma-70 factor, ECF subfamily